ncbi:hypothetical protein [Janthinobacterium sp. HH102]|uniref:hypothetical protein n=1 Tax=Janthinobacterium sp. HH102 TaxID=1537274 RepID=UPI00111313C5|nr:hypothetical protein [Janthinobacterium sp. HH102]
MHHLARAAAPAAVLVAVDTATFYLWNFLGRRGPAPLLLIAQPATCARSAPLAHQLASARARVNISAAGRWPLRLWIW